MDIPFQIERNFSVPLDRNYLRPLGWYHCNGFEDCPICSAPFADPLKDREKFLSKHRKPTKKGGIHGKRKTKSRRDNRVP